MEIHLTKFEQTELRSNVHSNTLCFVYLAHYQLRVQKQFQVANNRVGRFKQITAIFPPLSNFRRSQSQSVSLRKDGKQCT